LAQITHISQINTDFSAAKTVQIRTVQHGLPLRGRLRNCCN
jgi:hypothetical protein